MSDSPAKRFLRALTSTKKTKTVLDKHNTEFGREGDPKAPGDPRYPTNAPPPHVEVGGVPPGAPLPTQASHGVRGGEIGGSKQTLMILLRRAAQLYGGRIEGWNQMVNLSGKEVWDKAVESFGSIENVQTMLNSLPKRSEGKNLNVNDVPAELISRYYQGERSAPEKPKGGARTHERFKEKEQEAIAVGEATSNKAPKPSNSNDAVNLNTVTPTKPKNTVTPKTQDSSHNQIPDELARAAADLGISLEPSNKQPDKKSPQEDFNFYDINSAPKLPTPERNEPKPKKESVTLRDQPAPAGNSRSQESSSNFSEEKPLDLSTDTSDVAGRWAEAWDISGANSDFYDIKDDTTIEKLPRAYVEEYGKEKGLAVSTGSVVFVKDQITGQLKVLLMEPRNHYGGVEFTFPKGRLEKDLSMQQNAIKEVYEETGFKVKHLAHLGLYDKSTTANNFYISTIEGGKATLGDETQGVKVVPIEEAMKLLNVPMDRKILTEAVEKYNNAKHNFNLSSVPVVKKPYPKVEPGTKLPFIMASAEFSGLTQTIFSTYAYSTNPKKLKENLEALNSNRTIEKLNILAANGVFDAFNGMEKELVKLGIINPENINKPKLAYSSTLAAALSGVQLNETQFNSVSAEVSTKFKTFSAEDRDTLKAAGILVENNGVTNESLLDEVSVRPSELAGTINDPNLSPHERAVLKLYLLRHGVNPKVQLPANQKEAMDTAFENLIVAEHVTPESLFVNGKDINKQLLEKELLERIRSTFDISEDTEILGDVMSALRYGDLELGPVKDTVETGKVLSTDENQNPVVVSTTIKKSFLLNTNPAFSDAMVNGDSLAVIKSLRDLGFNISNFDGLTVNINKDVASINRDDKSSGTSLAGANGYTLNLEDILDVSNGDHYYRLMGEDAYQDMIKTGVIDTKGFSNYTDQGNLLYFHENPWIAASYVDTANSLDNGSNKKYFLVQIPKFDFADTSISEGSELRDMGQGGFDKPIPIEAVTGIVEIRPAVVASNSYLRVSTYNTLDNKLVASVHGGHSNGFVGIEPYEVPDPTTVKDNWDTLKDTIGGNLMAAKKVEIAGLTDRNVDPKILNEVFREFMNGTISRKDIINALRSTASETKVSDIGDSMSESSEAFKHSLPEKVRYVLENVFNLDFNPDTDVMGYGIENFILNFIDNHLLADVEKTSTTNLNNEIINRYVINSVKRFSEGAKSSKFVTNNSQQRYVQQDLVYDPSLMKEVTTPDGIAVVPRDDITDWTTDFIEALGDSIKNNGLGQMGLENRNLRDDGYSNDDILNLVDEYWNSTPPSERIFWRAMGAAQFKDIIASGKIRSNGNSNGSQEGKTLFADNNPANALYRYALGGETGGRGRLSDDIFLVGFNDAGEIVHGSPKPYRENGIVIDPAHKGYPADLTEVGVPEQYSVPATAIQKILAVRIGGLPQNRFFQKISYPEISVRTLPDGKKEFSVSHGYLSDTMVDSSISQTSALFFQDVPTSVLNVNVPRILSPDDKAMAYPGSIDGGDKPNSEFNQAKIEEKINAAIAAFTGAENNQITFSNTDLMRNFIDSLSIDNLASWFTMFRSEDDALLGEIKVPSALGYYENINLDVLKQPITDINNQLMNIYANPKIFSSLSIQDGKLAPGRKAWSAPFWVDDASKLLDKFPTSENFFAIVPISDINNFGANQGLTSYDKVTFYRNHADAVERVRLAYNNLEASQKNPIAIVAVSKENIARRHGNIQELGEGKKILTFNNPLNVNDITGIVEVQPMFFTEDTLRVRVNSNGEGTVFEPEIHSPNPTWGADKLAFRDLGSPIVLKESLKAFDDQKVSTDLAKQILDAISSGNVSPEDVIQALRLDGILSIDPPTTQVLSKTLKDLNDRLKPGSESLYPNKQDDIKQLLKELDKLLSTNRDLPFVLEPLSNDAKVKNEKAVLSSERFSSLFDAEKTGKSYGGGVFDNSEEYLVTRMMLSGPQTAKAMFKKTISKNRHNGGHLEALGYQLAKELGIAQFFPQTNLHKPEVKVDEATGEVKFEGIGSMMQIIENTMSAGEAGIHNISDLIDHLQRKYLKEGMSPGEAMYWATRHAQSLGVYDKILENPDRHSENILIDRTTGDVYWIDNGMIGRKTLSNGFAHTEFRPKDEDILQSVKLSFSSHRYNLTFAFDSWVDSIKKSYTDLKAEYEKLLASGVSGDKLLEIEFELSELRTILDTWDISKHSWGTDVLDVNIRGLSKI